MIGATTRRRVMFACFCVIIACSAVLIVNILADALKKDQGWLVGGFIVVLMTTWIIIEWALSPELVENRYWNGLFKPLRLARMGAIAIGGPLAISQALPMFEPGPMTKADIRNVLDEKQRDDTSRNHERVLQAIIGLWGESDCAVAYRFAVVRPAALIITWERRPAGEPVWRAVGTILAVNGNRVETRGESPDAERGKAASFTYYANGAVERLMWKDETRDVAAELTRCA